MRQLLINNYYYYYYVLHKEVGLFFFCRIYTWNVLGFRFKLYILVLLCWNGVLQALGSFGLSLFFLNSIKELNAFGHPCLIETGRGADAQRFQSGRQLLSF